MDSVYTFTTKKDFLTTIKDFKNEIEKENFRIVAKLNIHENIKSTGLDCKKKATVLEICNPKEAHELLHKDIMISAFMPCKVVVTEDNQNVQINFPKPTAILNTMESDEFKEIGKRIEDLFIQAIQKAV